MKKRTLLERMITFFLTFGAALLGILAGSVINFLADVLPLTRSLTPLICVHCGNRWPVFAYLMLQPCAHCHQRRSIRSFAVIILTALGFAALALIPAATGKMGFAISAIVLTYFGVVAVIDLEHRLILYPVVIAGVILGAGVGIWRHGWLSTALGGLVGFLIMFGLYAFGAFFVRWLSRRRGKETDEVALGYGDVNLSGVLGLLLGFPGIFAGLTLAIILGGVGSLVVIVIMLLKKRWHAFIAVPYAPFLVLAAAILLFR